MGKITKLHPRNNLLKVGIDTPTLMALDRFSEAIGRPKSRIVAEMLSGISPMLNQFADSANRLKQVTDGQQLAATVSQLSKEIDLLLERVHNG